MTASVPTGPIEKEPIEVIRGKTGKQLGFLLDDALRGSSWAATTGSSSSGSRAGIRAPS